jgi:ABC-type dipeptide/oligopeptide/nickel transport system permease component
VKVLRYAFQRLMLLVPVLLGVTLITFILLRVIPGDPIERVTSEFVPRARIEQLKKEAGLKDPLYVQYLRYTARLVRGDAGTSFVTGLPVTSELAEVFPATFELTAYGMLLTVLAGTILGVMAAVKRDSVIDHGVRAMAVAGFSIPLFWLGLILIYFVFFRLNLVPAPLGRIEPLVPSPSRITGLYTVDALLTGNWTALASSIRMLILPVVTLAASALAPVARMTRSEMIEALDSDYVRTAKSLGLSQKKILQQALRNGSLPIVTMIASIYGFLLSGSVLIESVFSWPGMGQYAFNAIGNSDYNAVQGYILFVTFAYVIVYLVLDLTYHVLDPRVQF